MGEFANRDGRGFGWEVAYAAVSRRPPIPVYTIVARTHMNTYAAEVWDSSIVQGPFSVAPRQTLALQANCRTHRPQKLKCLISLCTNPVSILSVPIQTVR
jgi:hypothetical protein